MSWPVISFGEIANFRNGLNYSRENFGTGLKIISVANFGSRLVPDLASLDEINPEGVAKAEDYLCDGDLLFVRSNGNRELVGRAMLMRGIDDLAVSYSGFCIRARFTERDINPVFYAYLFRTPIIRHQLTAGGVGANISNVSQKTLARLEVPFPPIDVQDAIVAVLSMYDQLIATNQRRINLLEETARSLYREWFVYLRFPGHEFVAVKDGVPEGWANLPLGDIAEITMGQSPESKYYNVDGDGLPFHQGVSNFGDRFITHETFTKLAKRLAESGDILCSVRAPVGRLNITRDKIAIGRGLSTMRSRANHQSLLFYQLANLFVEEDMIGGGAIFASVGKKELFAQQVLQPTENIAVEFDRLASDIDCQINNLDLQNRTLATARDHLLPKLMSGQLDVSSISLSDENAL